MMPPVGKSGPWTYLRISLRPALGCSTRWRTPAQTSVRLGARGVAVAAAEVPRPVDEEVAEAEVLGHADERVVGGLVAVGMEFPDDVADDAGRFLVGLVVIGPALGHGVEDGAGARLCG